MSLDPQVVALMRNTVLWEKTTGLDKNGAEQFATGKKLACHIEMQVEAVRGPETVDFIPRQVLYFDPDDENVQKITLGDRFTASGIGGGESVQASLIEPVYGPDGTPWLLTVTL